MCVCVCVIDEAGELSFVVCCMCSSVVLSEAIISGAPISVKNTRPVGVWRLQNKYLFKYEISRSYKTLGLFIGRCQCVNGSKSSGRLVTHACVNVGISSHPDASLVCRLYDSVFSLSRLFFVVVVVVVVSSIPLFSN